MRENIIRAILYQDLSVEWKDAELNGDVNVRLNAHQKARQFVEVELGDFLLSDGEAILASFEKSGEEESFHINPDYMSKKSGGDVYSLRIPPLVHNTPGEWIVYFFVVTDYNIATGEYTESYPFDKAVFCEYSSFLDDGLTVPSAENLTALYNSAQEAKETATSKANESNQSASQAASSATAAAQSETNAQTAETNATQAATQAQDSATSALNSANAAAISASQAQNAASANAKDIDNIYTLLGATVTDEYPLSQAYSTRETADGNADIIDGALTRVTKLQGATVVGADGTLKNAYFKGVRSNGKNLFNPDRTVKDFGAKYDNKAKRDFDEGAIYIGATANNYYDPSRVSNASYENGKFTFTVAPESYGIAIPFKVAPNTTYTFSKQILNGTNTRTSIGYYTSNGTFISFEYTKNTFTTPSNCGWVTVVVNNTTGLSVAQTISYDNVQLEYDDTATAYEPYKADESFMLDEAVPLGAWDYVDIQEENGIISAKHIQGTNTIVVDGTVMKFSYAVSNANAYGYALNASASLVVTSFVVNNNFARLPLYKDISKTQKGVYFTTGNTSELTECLVWFNKTLFTEADVSTLELANAYLKSLADAGNPLTIAYSLKTPTETGLAIPTDTYKAWTGGSETQVQGDTADTDNSEDGANCTVSQIYYTQKGA